jgi:uncharacterized protein (DUF488 family)
MTAVSSTSTSASAVGTLYTIGYANRAEQQRLGQLMQARHRLLVDIRLTPFSRAFPDFCREQLHHRYNVAEQAHLPVGERVVRYVWYRSLGNRNYRQGGPIQLASPEQGVRHVVAALLAGRDVILLCACADERHCHRLLVARLVQDALARHFAHSCCDGSPVAALPCH